MLYESTTKLPPAEALARAEAFFAGEYGLDRQSRDAREAGFTGGGGHVIVRVVREDPTTLELETREWDVAVQSFLAQLPR
ncbi:MAG TPA: hypothetical protein VNL77_05030 [Roseiflexaceae bacterium]|nr:hypothetical protein [Roseiflexaceae bacterium]